MKAVTVLKKRHIFFYTLLRPLVMLFLKIRFGYRYTPAKDLPEKYMVLSNHATDYDMLFVASSFKRPMYFLGSEHIARWKIFWLLKYAFDPIIRHKGAPATAAILELMRRVRQGANVCMFPEGVRTWDGVTCPILPATAKLAKSAGCGLVTYKLSGGYFSSPMWGGAGVRRGWIQGAPVHVLTQEQVAAMSVAELQAMIEQDLYEDAYQRQLADPKLYRSKAPAKGLENLLFRCPECGGTDCFRSRADAAVCSQCGLEVRYDTYGMLGGVGFRTVKELSDWQKEQVCSDIEQGVAYTAPMASLSTVKKHEESFVTKGAVSMTPEQLCIGEQVFPMADIADLSMHGQRAIVFTVKGSYYELLPEPGANVLKFMLYFDGCRKPQKVRVSR